MRLSEIHFGVVVAALEQFLHFLNRRLTGVRAGACVAERVHGYIVQSFEEYVFGHETLLARIAVRAVVLDAVGNIEVVAHLSEHGYEKVDFFVVILAAEVEEIGYFAVAFFSPFRLWS